MGNTRELDTVLPTRKAPRVAVVAWLVVATLAAALWAYELWVGRDLPPWGQPEDVPVYPAARGVSDTLTSHSDELISNRIRTITFHTKDAPTAVVSFYEHMLSPHGFRVVGDVHAPGRTVLELIKEPNTNPYLSVFLKTEMLADGLTGVEVKARISRQE